MSGGKRQQLQNTHAGTCTHAYGMYACARTHVIMCAHSCARVRGHHRYTSSACMMIPTIMTAHTLMRTHSCAYARVQALWQAAGKHAGGSKKHAGERARGGHPSIRHAHAHVHSRLFFQCRLSSSLPLLLSCVSLMSPAARVCTCVSNSICFFCVWWYQQLIE